MRRTTFMCARAVKHGNNCKQIILMYSRAIVVIVVVVACSLAHCHWPSPTTEHRMIVRVRSPRVHTHTHSPCPYVSRCLSSHNKRNQQQKGKKNVFEEEDEMNCRPLECVYFINDLFHENLCSAFAFVCKSACARVCKRVSECVRIFFFVLFGPLHCKWQIFYCRLSFETHFYLFCILFSEMREFMKRGTRWRRWRGKKRGETQKKNSRTSYTMCVLKWHENEKISYEMEN